jgi:putative methyltransferase (TIGR04325 family)
MASRVRTLLRDLAPPLLVRALRRSVPPAIHFEGAFTRWDDARARAEGYEQASILDAVSAATSRVTRGEAVYERDSVLFDHVEHSWPMLAGLLWAAARDNGRLHILDFGGALGTSYRQNKAFLDHVADVQWGVVDQPDYVAIGKECFSTDKLKFFETIGAASAALRPNVVTLGATLQYLPEPFRIIDQLSATPARVMVLDRTSFSNLNEDTITIQRVTPPIYTASYPCWLFSKPTFERRIPGGWKVASWFDSADGATATSQGTELTFSGLILVR